MWWFFFREEKGAAWDIWPQGSTNGLQPRGAKAGTWQILALRQVQRLPDNGTCVSLELHLMMASKIWAAIKLPRYNGICFRFDRRKASHLQRALRIALITRSCILSITFYSKFTLLALLDAAGKSKGFDPNSLSIESSWLKGSFNWTNEYTVNLMK